jgi:signal transduction histidine kinase
MWAYLAVRAVHLVQGAICVISGWSSYRRPRLAALVLGATWAESAWLIGRCVTTREVDALAARVDTLTGAGGLLGLAAATSLEDRTSSLNWMLPYSVGSTLALCLGVEPTEAWAGVAGLSGTYLGTSVRPGTRPGQVVTAAANAASFAGFHAVGSAIMRWGRRASAELDSARAESKSRGEKLAIERERNRQHRLLHDSALQTLEGIASGLLGESEEVRNRARSEARRLRQALAGTEPGGSLAEGLELLASEFAAQGLEVSHSMGVVDEPDSSSTEALLDAVREVLRNVTKHAQTSSAVVRADASDGGMKVVVRDHGRGFDPSETGPGFGLTQSVEARLGEVDGKVEVWARPGRGTRVTLWVPVR